MGRYMFRRTLGAIVVMWAVATLVFFMLRAVPGDPLQAMLFDVGDPEVANELRAKYGLDRPVFIQYFKWFGNVLQGDFGRAIAEYWADGPDSETPPGHWNLIANQIQDAPGFERRIGGVGPELDPLEWDVKTYFALNGAVHDAAIAAWGSKGHYDSVRPISMIRFIAVVSMINPPSTGTACP